MKQRIQQFLLILFALLQCVVPYAHAHAGGMDIGHALHIHEISFHALSADLAHVETDEGAVISMPEARPTSDVPSLGHPPAAPVCNPFTTTRCTAASGLSVLFAPALADTGHLSSWPQAPPHIVLLV